MPFFPLHPGRKYGFNNGGGPAYGINTYIQVALRGMTANKKWSGEITNVPETDNKGYFCTNFDFIFPDRTSIPARLTLRTLKNPTEHLN